MRIALVTLAIMALLLGPGCSAAPDPVEPAVESTRSDALLPLDEQGRGQLERVSVTPSGSYGVSPGTPEDEAQSLYGHRVGVGVFDSIEGVETKHVIPMWYGDATTYQLTAPSGGDPIGNQVQLVEAAQEKDGVVWWAGPNASISYHLQDGYFVLDSLVAPAPH